MKGLVCFVGTTAAKFVVYKRRFVCWSFPWDNSSSRYKAEVGKEVAFGDEEATEISMQLFSVMKSK